MARDLQCAAKLIFDPRGGRLTKFADGCFSCDFLLWWEPRRDVRGQQPATNAGWKPPHWSLFVLLRGLRIRYADNNNAW
jgi:hypothetical protein